MSYPTCPHFNTFKAYVPVTLVLSPLSFTYRQRDTKISIGECFTQNMQESSIP